VRKNQQIENPNIRLWWLALILCCSLHIWLVSNWFKPVHISFGFARKSKWISSSSGRYICLLPPFSFYSLSIVPFSYFHFFFIAFSWCPTLFHRHSVHTNRFYPNFSVQHKTGKPFRFSSFVPIFVQMAMI
jgi:hypothetical protein